MDFVYVYRERPAVADELRWSIRSVHANFIGNANVIIAGDRPNWFAGTVLNIPPMGGGFVDVANQTIQAALSPAVSDDFVWMMDDVIFCHAVTEEWLRRPRASGPIESDPAKFAEKGWRRRVEITAQAARAKGYESMFYATHLPHVMNSANVLDLAKKFDVLGKPSLLIEQLYGSVWFKHNMVHNAHKALCFINNDMESEEIEARRMNKPVLVYSNAAWGAGLRKWLEERFSVPAPWEIEGVTIKTPREAMIARMMDGQSLVQSPQRINWLECEHRSPAPIRRLNGRRCSYRRLQDVYHCSKFDADTALADIGLSDIRACNRCPVILDQIGDS